MSGPVVAPYGSWRSPITSDMVAGATLRLEQVVADGAQVFWVEGRPTEGGRSVLVRWGDDGVMDVTSAPFSVRSGVHEYGGQAYVVDDGVVYFSHFGDHRMYRQLLRGGLESLPVPISPVAAVRYADPVVDRSRGRLICVCEDHGVAGAEPVTTIVAMGMAGDEGVGVLVAGNDFYAAPRVSPDGRRLAWLTWNHPNMPWDGCELWVAMFAPDGSLFGAERVAGGLDESITQPTWSPDGVLYFCSDRSGWWNIYRQCAGGDEALCSMQAEFSVPMWSLGVTTFGFESCGQLVCAYIEQGVGKVARLDVVTGEFVPIALPYTMIRSLCVGDGGAVMLAAGPTEPLSVVRVGVDSGQVTVLRRSNATVVDSGYLSFPQSIVFPTSGGLDAFAFFYPPCNVDYQGPAGERPLLLVKSHGGPTGAVFPVLDFSIQYWTSRGIAVLDVNYGGSAGYGRAYRLRLNGNWGVVDVDDCVNGARYLVERGLVDGDRLLITGGSAGGYTTLCALTFRDVFRAGASHFGISDLEALEVDTHKFEARYTHGLVGPYPAERARYRERSPIHFVDRLSCPMILFQGLEDKVVLPNQAEAMAAALRAKGLPVALLSFAGEGHGFRDARNIRRALEAELSFYAQVFGFALADPVEPFLIENLSSL